MKVFALGRLHEGGKKLEYFRQAGLSAVWEDEFTPLCLCTTDELEWLMEQQAEQGCGYITEFELNLVGSEDTEFVITHDENEIVVNYLQPPTIDIAINGAEVFQNLVPNLTTYQPMSQG